MPVWGLLILPCLVSRRPQVAEFLAIVALLLVEGGAPQPAPSAAVMPPCVSVAPPLRLACGEPPDCHRHRNRSQRATRARRKHLDAVAVHQTGEPRACHRTPPHASNGASSMQSAGHDSTASPRRPSSVHRVLHSGC